MEAIIKIPGFQHVGEDIFKLLNKESVLQCRLVNSSWKRFIDRPMFWLKKLDSGITSLKEHQEKESCESDFEERTTDITQVEEKFSPETIHRHWKKLVKELEDANISTEFALILMKIYKKKSLFQPHTYTLENDAIHVWKIPDFKKFVFDHSAETQQYVYLIGYGTTKVYRTVQIFFMSGFINLNFIQRPELSINVSVYMEKYYGNIMEQQQQTIQ